MAFPQHNPLKKMVVVVKSQITTSHSLRARLLWSEFEYIYNEVEAINDADTEFLQDQHAIFLKALARLLDLALSLKMLGM